MTCGSHINLLDRCGHWLKQDSRSISVNIFQSSIKVKSAKNLNIELRSNILMSIGFLPDTSCPGGVFPFYHFLAWASFQLDWVALQATYKNMVSIAYSCVLPVCLAKRSRITKLFFPDLSDFNNIIKENKHFKVQLSEVKRDVLSVEKARQHQHNMSCVVA